MKSYRHSYRDGQALYLLRHLEGAGPGEGWKLSAPASCHKTRSAAWTTDCNWDLAFSFWVLVSMKAAMNRGGRCNSKGQTQTKYYSWSRSTHKPCSWNPVRPFVRSGCVVRTVPEFWDLCSRVSFSNSTFSPMLSFIFCKIIFVFIFNFYLYLGSKLSFRAFWCSLPHTVLQTLQHSAMSAESLLL